MGNKEKALLYSGESVVTEAKDSELNLSKTCENALKHVIKCLKSSKNN